MKKKDKTTTVDSAKKRRSTATVYKRKGSRVKDALSFSTGKKSKLV